MLPMIKVMGTNLKAMMYQCALSRSGLNRTPLRDALTKANTEPILDDVISQDWLNEIYYEEVQWVNGRNSHHRNKIYFASLYGMEAPQRILFQKGSSLELPIREESGNEIPFEHHSAYLLANS